MLKRGLNCQADGTGLSSEDYGIRDAGEVSHGAVEPSVPLSLPLILYRFFAALIATAALVAAFLDVD